MKSLELYCAIVNNGLGRKVVRIGKENGLKGATVFRGVGTVNNRIANILGLDDIRKEIILSGADKETGDEAIEEIYRRLKLHKPNRGICFSLPLEQIIGSKFYSSENKLNKNEEDKMGYKLILTIVDRGNADTVVEAAQNAGSQGATIINARGSGIHETKKVFNIEIEPEKEIVLILAKANICEDITSEIRKELNIEEPGKGIIFILDVSQTHGLYNE